DRGRKGFYQTVYVHSRLHARARLGASRVRVSGDSGRGVLGTSQAYISTPCFGAARLRRICYSKPAAEARMSKRLVISACLAIVSVAFVSGQTPRGPQPARKPGARPAVTSASVLPRVD